MGKLQPTPPKGDTELDDHLNPPQKTISSTSTTIASAIDVFPSQTKAHLDHKPPPLEIEDDIDSIEAVSFPPQPWNKEQLVDAGPMQQGTSVVNGQGQPNSNLISNNVSINDNANNNMGGINNNNTANIGTVNNNNNNNNMISGRHAAIGGQPLPRQGVANEGAGRERVELVPRAQLPMSRQGSTVRDVFVHFVGEPWSTGIFDCCQHPTNAILTCVAPCATFGQIAEIVDNGSTSCLTGAMLYVFLFLVLCHWNIGIRYRRRLRAGFQLSETPVTDRIAHAMFPLCALCQEFRELNNRDLNPFLGYNGIVAKRRENERLQQQLGNNAPAIQFMARQDRVQ